MSKTVFEELSPKDAREKLQSLKHSNKDIIVLIKNVNQELLADKPRKTLLRKQAIQLFNKKNFFKLKKFLRNLRILNIRSRKQIKEVFTEIKEITSLAQVAQTGDSLPLDVVVDPARGNLSLELLRYQPNTSNVTIIPREKEGTETLKVSEGKTKRRRRIKETKKKKLKTKKKKLKTKKKIDFKKLKKYISQRLKPKFRFRTHKAKQKK